VFATGSRCRRDRSNLEVAGQLIRPQAACCLRSYAPSMVTLQLRPDPSLPLAPTAGTVERRHGRKCREPATRPRPAGTMTCAPWPPRCSCWHALDQNASLTSALEPAGASRGWQSPNRVHDWSQRRWVAPNNVANSRREKPRRPVSRLCGSWKRFSPAAAAPV